MSERLSISIPGELHERLSHFKDRLKISKICQEAINHAVRIEEIKKEGEPNMEKLLARLKGESLQYGRSFIEKGFECGVRDAYGLSLDTFCEIQYFREGEYVGQLDNHLPVYQDMFSFASKETEKALEKLEDNDFGNEKWGLSTMLRPNKFFISGWLNGVSHIWDTVKPEVLDREVVEPKFIDPKLWGIEDVPEES